MPYRAGGYQHGVFVRSARDGKRPHVSFSNWLWGNEPNLMHDYIPDFIFKMKTTPEAHLILETKRV